MNRRAQIAVVSFFLLGISCKKDKDDAVEVTRSTTEVALKKNQVYKLTLGSPGDEEGHWISAQAKHYATSEIRMELIGAGQFAVYHYQPHFNYAGTDEVETTFGTGSDGASPQNKFHVTTIKFTITE